ncbi:MAG: tRNA (adenosine(37)-N6)-threonylcarbamoyltransferase complex dimerization subunit type 1 TsaB [Acidobacteriota bacterium]
MHILAIDTATNCGGAALSRDQEVIGLVMAKLPLRYSETILDMVDFLLKQHELPLSEIDCFAVATGPGSFTGVRIGLTTVKSFCQALDKPAVGISTLEALAYRFGRFHSRVAPMMDAGRQQIYGGLFTIDETAVHPEQEARVLAPEQWLASLPQNHGVLVGEGAQLYRETIAKVKPDAQILGSDNRLVDQLCRLAYHRFKQGNTCTAQQLTANYVRLPDAKVKRAG